MSFKVTAPIQIWQMRRPQSCAYCIVTKNTV